MRIIIIGCGQLGTAVAKQLLAAGHDVLGVRRSEPELLNIPLLAVPMPDDVAWQQLAEEGYGPEDVDAVLLCATPGLRRGKDNRLLETAEALVARYRSSRIIYTGSTSVYGEADGAAIDESGPLAGDAPSQGLLRVEQAVLKHKDATVLRVGAIVGPDRQFQARKIAKAAADNEPVPVRCRSPIKLCLRARPRPGMHRICAARICTRHL